MVTPDSLVAQFGEGLALTRVVNFEAGRDGVSDVIREIDTFNGVVSQPDESDSQELSGRLEDGAITVTVPSGTDVLADRDGGRDRILRPDPDVSTDQLTLWIQEGETYTVQSGTVEEYNRVRLEGELALEGEIVLTDTDTEIGDGVRAYTVESISRDKHPMVGIDKLTLMCSEFGGREDLAMDADTYTSA